MRLNHFCLIQNKIDTLDEAINNINQNKYSPMRCIPFQCLPVTFNICTTNSPHQVKYVLKNIETEEEFEEELIEIFESISKERMYRLLVQETTSEVDKIPPINIFLYKSYSEKNNKYSMHLRYYKHKLNKYDNTNHVQNIIETKKTI